MLSHREISSLLHDMKIPLHVISGYLSFLKESDLDDLQRQDLTGIENNIHFLTRLVSDLRVIFQGEDLKPHMERVDGRALLEEIATSFERAYGKRIKRDLPLSLSIEIDRHFLWRILSNLLENSCRYSPRESPLSLRVGKEQSGWSLSISNLIEGELSDAGYTPLEKVQQRDSTTPTGLGMEVAKRLSAILKGEVKIFRERDKMEVMIFFHLERSEFYE